jgi:hypothetical protein
VTSRLSPSFVIDQYGHPSPQNIPPPPPRPGDGQQLSPRRSHAANLPSLTTNLPVGPPNAHLLTPLSTTSLSSPFTAGHPRSYSPSSGALDRGVSPMAARMASYSVQYNPSEWSSGRRRPSGAENSGANAEGLFGPLILNFARTSR